MPDSQLSSISKVKVQHPISKFIDITFNLSDLEKGKIASLMGNREKTLYLAADSTRSLPTSQSFRNIPTIIAAYDNDPAGDEISKQIKEIIPHATRLRPKAKDWNEQLEKQTPTQTKKQFFS